MLLTKKKTEKTIFFQNYLWSYMKKSKDHSPARDLSNPHSGDMPVRLAQMCPMSIGSGVPHACKTCTGVPQACNTCTEVPLHYKKASAGPPD